MSEKNTPEERYYREQFDKYISIIFDAIYNTKEELDNRYNNLNKVPTVDFETLIPYHLREDKRHTPSIENDPNFVKLQKEIIQPHYGNTIESADEFKFQELFDKMNQDREGEYFENLFEYTFPAKTTHSFEQLFIEKRNKGIIKTLEEAKKVYKDQTLEEIFATNSELSKDILENYLRVQTQLDTMKTDLPNETKDTLNIQLERLNLVEAITEIQETLRIMQMDTKITIKELIQKLSSIEEDVAQEYLEDIETKKKIVNLDQLTRQIITKLKQFRKLINDYLHF
jgi:hypothetical protein